MIDLHCHILPGLDDGPRSLEDALSMCRMAAEDGIRSIVAMPHTLNGAYSNDPEGILQAVRDLNRALKGSGMDLEILPGADVHVDPDISAMIRRGRVMTIDNAGRSVMLEFPDYFLPEVMCRFVRSLSEDGLIPVISHPERCTQFQDRALLREMIRLGAVSQVTAMSITGEFGRRVQQRVQALLEEGLVHVIASDAHSPRHRPPVLSRALEAASAVVGGEAAGSMVRENPMAVIRGMHPSGLSSGRRDP